MSELVEAATTANSVVASEEATLPYTIGGLSHTAEPEHEPESDAYGDHSDDAPPKKQNKIPPEEATETVKSYPQRACNPPQMRKYINHC